MWGVSEQRDGSWIDKWGACKLCGGEIPYGHAENCDLWKVEKERDAAQAELEDYKSGEPIRIAREHQLRAENSALKLELGTQTSIAAHLEYDCVKLNAENTLLHAVAKAAAKYRLAENAEQAALALAALHGAMNAQPDEALAALNGNP